MNDDLANVTEDSARGGFFLMSGSILSTVIMGVAAILVGRFLGPGLYGEYVLALLIPNLFLLFTDLGINAGITKFSASLRVRKEEERIPRIILYGLMFQTIVGLAVFIIDFVFADTFAALINRPGTGLYIRIVSVSILFQVAATTSNAAFVGLDKAQYSALTTNVMAATKTVTSVVLVLLGFGIAGAAIGFTAGYMVASVIALTVLFSKILRRNNKTSKGGFWQTLKTLSSYGTPLYAAVLLVGFTPLYLQVILTSFASNADIGNYSVASNFLTIMSVIPVSITTALLPAFSKLDSSSPESVRTFFRRANKYSCIVVVPIAALLMLFAKQIVEIVYGSAFQLASSFLLIGCLPYLLVGIGYLTLTSLFNGLGETRTTLKIALVAFIISISLAPFLARTYGVVGVIISYLPSSIVSMLYGAYVARSKFKVQFEAMTTARIYLVSAASAVPPLLLVQFVPLSSLASLVIGGAIFILLYITLTPMAKIMSHYELNTAMQVAQNIKLLSSIAKPVLQYQERILQMRTKRAL